MEANLKASVPLRKSREQMEREELGKLVPWAQFSGASAGRKYPDAPHPYRTGFQRDRARIIHSRAFRRLEGKTQVFLNGAGDHLRTRLTHSIEVASVSRTIARALALNEDLAEAIALAHDLGHSPVGHTGEETLHRLMTQHGGFDHNAQSLRAVELIESGYPDFPGLNLSNEVIEGLRKHQTLYDNPPAHADTSLDEQERFACPSLEAQIANLADEIAYNSHDLDDGLSAGLLRPEQLDGVALWRQAREEAAASFPSLGGHELYATTIRRLIDLEVEDVIATSAACIADSRVRTADDVRKSRLPLIRYGEDLMAGNHALREFLYANLYYHPDVRGANERACAMLARVFSEYIAHPERLGAATAARIEKEGLHRAVCDYVSGMTDRYLMEEYKRLS